MTMVNPTKQTAADNPYRPPNAGSPPQGRRRPVAIQVMTILLLVAYAVGLAAETYEHESIVVSGPILFLFGLVLTFVAIRRESYLAAALGSAVVLLCLLVVFLVNFNGWGPAQGDAPITIIAWAFAVVFMPFAIWSLLHRTEAVTPTGAET